MILKTRITRGKAAAAAAAAVDEGEEGSQSRTIWILSQLY